jgi:hypothetical protein
MRRDVYYDGFFGEIESNKKKKKFKIFFEKGLEFKLSIKITCEKMEILNIVLNSMLLSGEISGLMKKKNFFFFCFGFIFGLVFRSPVLFTVFLLM